MDTYLWIILVTTLIYAFYKWSTKNYGYFKEKGVAHEKPWPLLGNTARFFFKPQPITDALKYQHNLFPNEKIVGGYSFMTPGFLIRDPNLIKQIAVKDFDYFMDHQSISKIDPDDLIGNVLTVLTGQKWKDMRATLSPAFTGNKMRLMFQLINECGDQMATYLLKEIDQSSSKVFDMKKLFSQYTNDVITSCAFGIKVDSMTNQDNELIRMAQALVNPNKALAIIRFIFIKLMPGIAKRMGVALVDKKLNKFFSDLMMETIHTREKDKIIRPDMIQLLMEARKGKLVDDDDSTDHGTKTSWKWNDTELIAQCFLFFLAGFETTSQILSFTAYELATNSDVQRKLIAEIDETRKKLNGPLTYIDLQSMAYLEMVFSEGLRKWPPAIATDRLCIKDYILDDGCGKKILIEKDKQVVFPIYGIHHDEQYFPNPDRFDPERFSAENQSKIVPGTYLPFGIGPRSCIASRFALLEIKCIMFHLLTHFTFEVCDKTTVPLKSSRFQMLPDEGIHLSLKRRKQIQ